jgi:hypothetical protein
MGFSHLHQKTGFVLLADQGRQANNNYVTLVDKNGLIQVVARQKTRSLSLTPITLLAIFAVLLTVFKALALMNVGLNDYQDEVAALEAGNLFEQAGAFVLQVDPATMAIYSISGSLFQ